MTNRLGGDLLGRKIANLYLRRKNTFEKRNTFVYYDLLYHY
jgi:hypothetical protein